MILSKAVNLIGMPRLIGKKSGTLKFSVQYNRSVYDAIGFNMVEKYEYLLSGEPVDMVFEIGNTEAS